MLDNLISDLYLSIFQYLSIKDLNTFRCISQYLYQFCFFFNLIDWSSKIDWSQLKITLNNQEYNQENIQKHNIHNWYKILKYQRQESPTKSTSISWRNRSCSIVKKIIHRQYYLKKRILRRIISHVNTDWNILSIDSPMDLYCERSSSLRYWYFYDNCHQLLAKMKIFSFILGKVKFFHILRPNNKKWFIIKYRLTAGGPRSFQLYNFESKIWENSTNLEVDLSLSNNDTYEVSRSEEYGTLYCLKYNHIRPNQASTRNCSILYKDNSIYELGKFDNNFLYAYQYPLHGLYAFILSCCQILL